MSKRVSLILRDADEAMIAPFLHRGLASFRGPATVGRPQ